MRWGSVMKCPSEGLPGFIIHQQPSCGWGSAWPSRQEEKPQEQIWSSSGLLREITQPLTFVSWACFLEGFILNMSFQTPYQLFCTEWASLRSSAPSAFQSTKICVSVSLLSSFPNPRLAFFFGLSPCLCSCAPSRTLVLLSDYLCGQGEPFVLDESYLYNPLSGERGYLWQVSVYLHLTWYSWMGEKIFKAIQRE